jgi:hypothetical protein
LVRKGKLNRFTAGRPRVSPSKSPKKKFHFEWEESPLRKVWSVAVEERTDGDNNNEDEGKRKPVFLEAIMGGFATSSNDSKGTTKRKIDELMAVHATTSVSKVSKKRQILEFADNEKVDGVSNEDLPLYVIAEIHGHMPLRS